MTSRNPLHERLAYDISHEVSHIVSQIRTLLRTRLKKRGLVVAVSGGIDSAVAAALSVRALGPDKVLALLLPESDSSGESTRLGRRVTDALGVACIEKDISGVLESMGCYQWRDDAIKEVFPEYGPGWKNKIVIGGGLEGGINHFSLIVEDPSGGTFRKRLGLKQYLQIVAATNFKQRVRKNLEYFHADRLNYAVVGTPNRLEYDQGFFVKNGDGAADIKPIAHLYKSQVYAMARHLELPAEICAARPTTDTYSLPQGQEEFYYALPYEKMDLALWCADNGGDPQELARMINVTLEAAGFVLKDIEMKRRTTAPLHWGGLLVRPVDLPSSSPD